MSDTDRFDHDAAPIRIGGVRLRVRDLDRTAAFYREVLGLAAHPAPAGEARLGTSGQAFLELAGDPAAAPAGPRSAGLFHVAFLLPDRAALGRWVARALERGVPLEGASDHRVSEAIYLSDPEGNGIEVYADRPPAGWRDGAGRIRMATEPLDLPGLIAAGRGEAWAGFPEAGRIGHVHLRVGDTAAAAAFLAGVLGLEETARYPGALFLSSGGYHHHLAANVWQSRGAGPRAAGAAGLDRVVLTVPDADLRRGVAARAAAAGRVPEPEGAGFVLADPWGTRFAILP